MAEAGETKHCTNCKRDISANNFVMHEMHCRRHIGLCEHCKEPFPKNELEAHFHESHAMIKCPKCSVEVEIMHLEDHEENHCSKKPMHCVYCELEFPKSELQAHLDYCGSRTEPCVKCGNFIMLKDQQKHDESKCHFPEPAKNGSNGINGANAALPGNNNRTDFATFGNIGGHMELPVNNNYRRDNPFNMAEFERMLSQGPSSPPGFEPMPSAASGAGVKAKKTAPLSKAQPRVDRKLPAKTNNTRADLNNKKRDNTSRQTTESEYDRMLAAQLASDLNSTKDFMQAFEKPRSPVDEDTGPDVLGGGYDVNTFNDDEVTIPCEFCGQLCVFDELVQHQSACSLDRISSMLPNRGTKANGLDVPNTFHTSPTEEPAVFREIRSPLVQNPQIIDNLRGFQRPDWDVKANAGGEDMGHHGDDSLMLPCEFCDELFPVDSLVQHQAMCDHNRTVTPRPPSPKTRAQKKTGPNRFTSEFPNLASRRHQPPSSILDDSDDDTRPFDTDPRNPIGAVHKIHKPKPSVVKNGGAAGYSGFKTSTKPSAGLGISSTSPRQETRTLLRKYGVETPDRGDHYRGSRQGGQARRNSDHDNDSWLQPSVTSSDNRRSGSASRTRSTLDNLLNETDDTSSSHDLLGHIGAGRDRKANQSRQTVTVKQSNSRVAAKVRTSSRDVQRELAPARPAAGPTASNGILPPKNRSNRGFEVRVRPQEADETSDLVTGGRGTRSRANHVFNKPPTTRKKTDFR